VGHALRRLYNYLNLGGETWQLSTYTVPAYIELYKKIFITGFLSSVKRMAYLPMEALSGG
jgi:hypothetical protein